MDKNIDLRFCILRFSTFDAKKKKTIYFFFVHDTTKLNEIIFFSAFVLHFFGFLIIWCGCYCCLLLLLLFLLLGFFFGFTLATCVCVLYVYMAFFTYFHRCRNSSYIIIWFLSWCKCLSIQNTPLNAYTFTLVVFFFRLKKEIWRNRLVLRYYFILRFAHSEEWMSSKY